jgi:ribonuclease D
MISRFLPHPVRRLLGVKSQTRARLPAYRLIDQPGQLGALLEALDRVSEVTLDTEADNMFHYRVRLCLMQFLIGEEVFLLDVLAPIDLKPLWPRLAAKHLVMHGSDFDLRLLHDLCGFRAKSLFDTVLAGQILGRARVGLASLIEEEFKVQLDKDGQRANWSKRPLTKKLLDYAALDVWYLPTLRDLMTRQLRRAGRLGWLEEQCQAQIESGATGFTAPGENDWRIGKSERLRGQGLAVLHAVWHWREDQARRLDTPPFKVCSNDLLLNLAFGAEAGESASSLLAKVNLGKRHPRLIGSLGAAVNAGCERDPSTLPRRPGRDPNHQPLTQAELDRLDRIKADRDRIAAGLAIEATLIANRSQLAQIARDPGRLADYLQPWQAKLLAGAPSLQRAPRRA